ncbi:MAG: MoaD/ThiS family protein [Nitrospinae bacterium]|nr:MoaD/ThiS family protein [Nitrospinota bacterium]
MAITVRIPTPLQGLTQNRPEVEVKGSNIKELVEDLDRQYPGIKERICDETGAIRRFVNIYLNDEDIRFIDGDSTAVREGDDVSIIPAIAGGSYQEPS